VRRFATLLLAPVLVGGLLSGCGGSTGPAVDKSLPTITGHYGDKPKITIAKGVKASKKLKSAVLKKGTGPKIIKGDLLVADYLGAIYRTGAVFDNSYDTKVPLARPIGIGQLVPGWDKTLVGVHAGSRVLMVLPPKYGYGPKGNPQSTPPIKATDSLVFVVDIIASYGANATTPAPTPVASLPKGLPTVSGAWGAEPKITIAKSTKAVKGPVPPKAPVATVLETGTGAKTVKGHLVVTQYAAVTWDGKDYGKTWGAGGPQALPTSVTDLFAGTPVGSRVLLTLPPQQQGADPATQSAAVVIDILAQNGTAKEESKS
jgi:peptidylprolyl isomerase